MPARKKILYFVTRAVCGGAQVHLLELLRGMTPSFECGLVVGAEGFLSTAARRLGVQVFVMPEMVVSVDPLRDFRAVKKAKQLIDSFQPDIVHAHSSKAGLVARIAARSSGVCAVFTAHGWAFSNGRPLANRIAGIPAEWIGARLCQKIITVCDRDRSLCLKNRIAPPSKIQVIYNGVPDCRERSRPGSGNVVRLVMVARFEEPKDQKLVLEVMRTLPESTHLALVGDGPTRQSCEALAANLGIADRVLFMGADSDVCSVLSESSVFVLASKWEGLPLSILEAMRAGLPVIASNVGGVSEALIDGDGGFLVPSGDRDALRSKLSLLISQPELRAQMGEAGRKRFAEFFTADRMVDAVRTVYRSYI